MHAATGQLKVTPDSTTPGSEGRLCLQLPKEMGYLVGYQFTTLGKFYRDKSVLLLPAGRHGIDRHSVTPKLQVWWKNGVRDHDIRQHYFVKLFFFDSGELLVLLGDPIPGHVPVLPPHQETLFAE